MPAGHPAPLRRCGHGQCGLGTRPAADLFASAGHDLAIPGPFHELVPGSSVHFAGTARMHDDPAFGVLDRWNRVHDAPNVVVCDSSCFPTGPEKNPTLTAMAIAIRAADHLADDLGFSPLKTIAT